MARYDAVKSNVRQSSIDDNVAESYKAMGFGTRKTSAEDWQVFTRRGSEFVAIYDNNKAVVIGRGSEAWRLERDLDNIAKYVVNELGITNYLREESRRLMLIPWLVGELGAGADWACNYTRIPEFISSCDKLVLAERMNEIAHSIDPAASDVTGISLYLMGIGGASIVLGAFAAMSSAVITWYKSKHFSKGVENWEIIIAE